MRLWSGRTLVRSGTRTGRVGGASRAGYDVYRDLVNTPAFFALLPGVDGLFGLDVGCGEGHNTRLLVEAGADVVALDTTTVFIMAAATESRPGSDSSSPTAQSCRSRTPPSTS